MMSVQQAAEEELKWLRENTAPTDYLEPGESRRPTLTWPREIPFDGTPEDVAAIVDTYAQWLTMAPLPKLFINADPVARESPQPE